VEIAMASSGRLDYREEHLGRVSENVFNGHWINPDDR
jgi:hypothetical protein